MSGKKNYDGEPDSVGFEANDPDFELLSADVVENLRGCRDEIELSESENENSESGDDDESDDYDSPGH